MQLEATKHVKGVEATRVLCPDLLPFNLPLFVQNYSFGGIPSRFFQSSSNPALMSDGQLCAGLNLTLLGLAGSRALEVALWIRGNSDKEESVFPTRALSVQKPDLVVYQQGCQLFIFYLNNMNVHLAARL